MAERYCDHGLYGAAVVVGSTSGSSTTLTVASVTSGRLGLGAMITGDGITANTWISALGTGKGGAGTYTMSTARTIPAGTTITAIHGGPALEPEWGVAQEGDGTAIGAATAATVDLNLSAATAAAGATISIMGATLTCVASGASTNQFNAGSGATLVSNLVTAINRTTNTSVVAAQATGWDTPKVQDAVFARIGSPTTTLQIMTRAGSATYNASQVTTSGFTGGTFGPYTFTGGAGGAWGYLFNERTTIWPSAIAFLAYGAWGASQPIAGVQQSGDTTHIRAGNKTITAYASDNTLTIANISADANNPLTHLVDDGTVWPADGANPTLTIAEYSSNGVRNFNIQFNPAISFRLTGKAYSASNYNLKLEAHTGRFVLQIGNNNVVENFSITTPGATSASTLRSGVSSAGYTAVFRNGYVEHNSNSAFVEPNFVNASHNISLENVTLSNGTSVIPNTAGVISVANGYPVDATVTGLKCVNFIVTSKLFKAGTVNSPRINFIDCDYGNVSGLDNLTLASNVSGYITNISSFSSRDKRDFMIFNNAGVILWDSQGDFPALNATLLDGVTKWSWRLSTALAANSCTIGRALTTPRIVKINSLAAGARTFTVEFCITDALSWTKRDVSLKIVYEDVNGDLVILNTLDINAGALTTSSATWSNESGGKVTYSVGSVLYHNKFKLQISTPVGKNLPEGAEVAAYFNVHNINTSYPQFLFVDPDVSIA